MKTSRNITVSAIVVLILAMAFVPITAAESQVAPHDKDLVGDGDWGDVTGTWLSTLTHFHSYRIRSSDDITRAELWAVELDWFDEFYIEIWRENATIPGTFDKITETENLNSKFHEDGGVNSIVFDTPLTGIREGDFYGMVVHRTVTGFSPFKRIAEPDLGNGYESTYFNQGGDANTHQAVGKKAYAWRTRSGTLNAQPISLFTAKNTEFIFVGDSITEGYHNSTSMYSQRAYWTEKYNTHNLDSYGWAPNAKFETLTGMSTQNMANYSAETIHIVPRWNAILALNPDNIVLAIGVNDVKHNPGVPEADIITNKKMMIHTAMAAGIQVYAVDIFAYGAGGDNARHQEIDRINAEIRAYAIAQGAYIVNTDSRIAHYDPGGDPGNLWSIDAEDTSDNLHLSELGNEQFAAAVYEVYLANQPDPPERGTFSDTFDELNGITNDAWSMMGILPIVLIAGVVLTIVMAVFAVAPVDPKVVIAVIPVIILAITTMYVGLMIIDALPK